MCNSRKVGGDKIHLWLNYLWRGLKCSLESMKQPFTEGEAVVCRLLSDMQLFESAEAGELHCQDITVAFTLAPHWVGTREMWWSVCPLWLAPSSPFLGADGVQENSSKERHWEHTRDLAKVTTGSSGISPATTSSVLQLMAGRLWDRGSGLQTSLQGVKFLSGFNCIK